MKDHNDLRRTLQEIVRLASRFRELNDLIKERDAIAEKLKAYHRDVLNYLEMSDCMSPGNYGWEVRIIGLLTTIVGDAAE